MEWEQLLFLAYFSFLPGFGLWSFVLPSHLSGVFCLWSHGSSPFPSEGLKTRPSGQRVLIGKNIENKIYWMNSTRKDNVKRHLNVNLECHACSLFLVQDSRNDCWKVQTIWHILESIDSHIALDSSRCVMERSLTGL